MWDRVELGNRTGSGRSPPRGFDDGVPGFVSVRRAALDSDFALFYCGAHGRTSS